MGKKVRAEQILQAALPLAAARGYNTLSREVIAAAAKLSPAMVNVCFGTMTQFRRALMRHAVAEENLCVVAQGLSVKDRYAMRAPEKLKVAAARNLLGPQ